MRTLTLQTQPQGEPSCTQYAVAMITEQPAQHVCETLGHRRAASLDECLRVLRIFGYNTELREYYGFGVPAGRGLIRIEVKGQRIGHMVAYAGGVIYDPHGYVFRTVAALTRHYRDEWQGLECRVSHVIAAAFGEEPEPRGIEELSRIQDIYSYDEDDYYSAELAEAYIKTLQEAGGEV